MELENVNTAEWRKHRHCPFTLRFTSGSAAFAPVILEESRLDKHFFIGRDMLDGSASSMAKMRDRRPAHR